jgi:hypothetical protein
MAFAGYKAGVAILFIPCAMLAVGSLFLVIVGIIRFIYDWIYQRLNNPAVVISDDRSRERFRDD